eukprot:m.34918 g.34918  ORF g.34918 m.34918 type:complete len:109 (+) comp7386_c0_seq1:2095-2421(+)
MIPSHTAASLCAVGLARRFGYLYKAGKGHRGTPAAAASWRVRFFVPRTLMSSFQAEELAESGVMSIFKCMRRATFSNVSVWSPAPPDERQELDEQSLRLLWALEICFT